MQLICCLMSERGIVKDGITDAIIYHLLEHFEEVKRMGENGRRAVEERYNWKKMEQHGLLDLYEGLETCQQS